MLGGVVLTVTVTGAPGSVLPSLSVMTGVSVTLPSGRPGAVGVQAQVPSGLTVAGLQPGIGLPLPSVTETVPPGTLPVP